jgi:hypothetical protein
MCLFAGGAYANACRYPIPVRDLIDIGIRVIKRCGLYAEEYKQWIARGKANAVATPPMIETFNSFKTLWSDKITLVNQTSVPASLHGYGTMATTDNLSVGSYEESLANFGAAYAATQESVKSQASTIAMMQSQMQAMQQYCMNVQQFQQAPAMQYQQQQLGRRETDCRGGGTHAPAPTAAAAMSKYTHPPSPF